MSNIKNENKNNHPEVQDKPKIKASSLMKIKGRDIATYEGVIDYAHQNGLVKLKSQIIQYPSPDNNDTAICEAVVLTADGREFSDIGDANPTNTPKGCSAHYIRIASTRAKTRALYDAFNIKSALNLDDVYDTSAIDVDFTVIEQASLPESHSASHPNQISPKQMSFIKNLSSARGINDKDIQNIAKDMFNKDINSLSTKEAHAIIKNIKEKPA